MAKCRTLSCPGELLFGAQTDLSDTMRLAEAFKRAKRLPAWGDIDSHDRALAAFARDCATRLIWC